MSERMLDEIREKNKMVERVEQLEIYLGLTERTTFTTYDVQKMLDYIRNGKGWI